MRSLQPQRNIIIEPWILSDYSCHTFDLHCGPKYTAAKFHVSICNSCNAIVLTRFADSAEHTHLPKTCNYNAGPQSTLQDISPEPFFSLLNHTQTNMLKKIPTFAIAASNHRLRGSASTVLTATGQVNGRWRILTPHRIEAHEPTATTLSTIDYVRGRTP